MRQHATPVPQGLSRSGTPTAQSRAGSSTALSRWVSSILATPPGGSLWASTDSKPSRRPAIIRDPKIVRLTVTERASYSVKGGAGAVFIESEDAMARRAARPLAEICGFAQTADARSMVAISTDTGAQLAMYKMVLEEAAITPTAIDYINSHGTGTVMNDEIESHLLATLFGERVLVNSTKSILGHSVGASGAVEAVVTIRSILDQQVHPCRNLENPVSGLSFVLEPRKARIRYALTQSFGFGGHNAALIFREAQT